MVLKRCFFNFNSQIWRAIVLKNVFPKQKFALTLTLTPSTYVVGGCVCLQAYLSVKGKKIENPCSRPQASTFVFKIKNAFTMAKCSNFYTNEGNTVLGKIDFFLKINFLRRWKCFQSQYLFFANFCKAEVTQKFTTQQFFFFFGFAFN
jgi:hypothetical protein